MNTREPTSKRLYEQVADQLSARIAAGTYIVGERLPSERDLAAAFGVSRPTVREAVIALELDGLVEVKTGSGVYVIARAPDRWRNILLMLVILPFWTSFLLRVYALSSFLRGEGVINNFIGLFGIPPLVMMQTDFAVYVGIVYSYLPFFNCCIA